MSSHVSVSFDDTVELTPRLGWHGKPSEVEISVMPNMGICSLEMKYIAVSRIAQASSAYLDSPCGASSFSFKVVLLYLLLIATTMTFHIQSTTSFLKQLTLSPFHASISTSVVHKAGFALWCPCSGGRVFPKTLVDVGFQCGAQPLDLGRATRCWSTMVDICVFDQSQDLGGCFI